MLAVYGITCSGRGRDNPLDPQNPVTGGKTDPPALISCQDTVQISWHGFQTGQVAYYRIFRTLEDSDTRTAIGTSVTAFYQDSGLPLGRIAGYQISAVTGSGYESMRSEKAFITPGPHDYWAADYYGESILRLSYDAMHVISSIRDVMLPAAVVADTAHHKIWAIDRRDGVLLKIFGDRVVRRTGGFLQPRLLTLDRTNQVLWMVQDSLREIVMIDTAGNVLRKIHGFGRITGLTWAGGQYGCWLADADSHWVGLLDPAGNVTARIPVTAPLVIEAAGSGGEAWTADSSSIFRVYPDGVQQLVTEFSGLTVIAVDADRNSGSYWLALRSPDFKQRVRKLNFEGQVLCEITGFGNIYDILADPFDGGCLVADFQTGQVIRISTHGTVISRFSQLNSPISLDIG